MNLSTKAVEPRLAGTLILAYAGYAQSALYWLCSCYTMLVLHTSILGFQQYTHEEYDDAKEPEAGESAASQF